MGFTPTQTQLLRAIMEHINSLISVFINLYFNAIKLVMLYNIN